VPKRTRARLRRREPFARLTHELGKRRVRYVLIGVSAVNLYARSAGLLFTTDDRDMFVPTDPENALRAWRACEAAGFALWCGEEPLGRPLDRFLAEQVVARRALVRGQLRDVVVDLSFVMAGFDFEDVWARRRRFRVQGIEVPVAALSDIVRSKAAVGRPKDRLFLAAHEDALRQLLGERSEDG